MMHHESSFLPVNNTDTLHIKRWYAYKDAPAMLLIHGSIENGRIFYSENGKGFAPYLAAQGYDVFVPDLRGRGRSTPAIGRGSDFGQMDMVKTDFNLIAKHIQDLKGTDELWAGAHSWGGNLLLAWAARYPDAARLRGMVMFGVKRRVTVWNAERLLKLSFGWRVVAPVLIRTHGYLPAVKARMGADNETKKIFRETNFWLDRTAWTDPVDGFDYGRAMKDSPMPPILSLTGAADKVLGHPRDCENLLRETSAPWDFKVIGKRTGHRHDYGHIDLVTHKDAPSDHFPLIAEWMEKVKSAVA